MFFKAVRHSFSGYAFFWLCIFILCIFAAVRFSFFTFFWQCVFFFAFLWLCVFPSMLFSGCAFFFLCIFLAVRFSFYTLFWLCIFLSMHFSFLCIFLAVRFSFFAFFWLCVFLSTHYSGCASKNAPYSTPFSNLSYLKNPSVSRRQKFLIAMLFNFLSLFLKKKKARKNFYSTINPRCFFFFVWKFSTSLS